MTRKQRGPENNDDFQKRSMWLGRSYSSGSDPLSTSQKFQESLTTQQLSLFYAVGDDPDRFQEEFLPTVTDSTQRQLAQEYLRILRSD